MYQVNFENRIKKIQAKGSSEHKNLLDQQRVIKEKNNIIYDLLSSCNISPRYKNKTISDFDVKNKQEQKIKYVIERYISTYQDRIKVGSGLLMLGNTGTGKTLAASIIVNEVIFKYQQKCLYINAIDLIRDIRSTYKTGENTSKKIMTYMSYSLIVIDEIGVQTFSQDEILLLNEVIDKRYSHLKATIIISNMSRDEIALKLGNRVISRLIEGGGYELKFTEEDRRLK